MTLARWPCGHEVSINRSEGEEGQQSDLPPCPYCQITKEGETVLRLERCVKDLEKAQEIRAAALRQLHANVTRLERWIDDLQAGAYINCVYCGHRYGPDTKHPAILEDGWPEPMREALRQHIARCPAHPMSLQREILRRVAEAYRLEVTTRHDPLLHGTRAEAEALLAEVEKVLK